VTEGRADARSAHLPVLFAQVMKGLRVVEDGTYLDGTFGRGGHACGVLGQLGTKGRLLLMDKDPEAIAQAEADFGSDPRVAIRRGSFADLAAWNATEDGLDGVLFDLGVSSPQFDEPTRGFSFRSEGPLDMRMDQSSGRTAADIVNELDEADLADMIYRLGEERYSRRIARAIVSARRRQALTSTHQLASVIESAVPGHYRRGRIHCATRTFQALRIAVNKELDHLETSLRDAADALAPQGRLCVISFHSLEDRIVKQTFKGLSSQSVGELEILTKRPQVPSDDERHRNPRSRSAKLRVMQRIIKEGRA